MRLLSLAVCTMLCQVSTAHADEIYRWVDAHGNVHFSSTPTSDAASEKTWDAKKSGGLRIVRGANPAAAQERSGAPKSSRSKPAPSFKPGLEPERTPSYIQSRSRKSWRAEARGHENRVQSLERNIERTDDQLTDTPNFRSWRSLARWEARMEKRLEGLEKQLEKAVDDQDEFETRAHRAGVPPSWLQD